MKAAGVIVEYNPFHNGHRYHLEKVKELTKADVVIAVMSGDFTQRGEIACLDRWKRAEMALGNGVDIVAELPIFYSSQSAEIFATGAVKILNELGVDVIVFGSESGSLENLKQIAGLEEDEKFKEILAKNLKLGISYPSAYSVSLEEADIDIRLESNDILGIEYIKAINKLEREIEILPIKRIGAGYHSVEAVGEIASATGIRHMVKNRLSPEEFIPEKTLELIENEKFAELSEYYELLRYAILIGHSNLKNIQDMEVGFENKLYESALQFNNYMEFMESIRSKRYTVGRIQRVLIHVLTGLTKEITISVKRELPYVRVMGFNTKGREYLNLLKKQERGIVPIISAMKNLKKFLNDEQREFFLFNERASEIYKMKNYYQERKIPILAE